MDYKKISDAQRVTSITGDELIPVSLGDGDDKAISVRQLIDYIFNNSAPIFATATSKEHVHLSLFDKDAVSVPKGAVTVSVMGEDPVVLVVDDNGSVEFDVPMGKVYSVVAAARAERDSPRVTRFACTTARNIVLSYGTPYDNDLPNGVYMAFEDGTFARYYADPASEAAQADPMAWDGVSASNAAGARGIGAAVKFGNVSFIFSTDSVQNSTWSSNVSLLIPNISNSSADVLGDQNTSTIIAALPTNCPAAKYCRECYISFAGEKRFGYLPAIGELVVAKNNNAAINAIRAVLGAPTVNLASGSYWSSSQSSAGNAWRLGNGSPTSTGSPKTNSNTVLPFYEFSLIDISQEGYFLLLYIYVYRRGTIHSISPVPPS